MDDVRLYEVKISQSENDIIPIGGITPIPYSQALNGVSHNNCFYFTRFKQSSQTNQYVGGTAEKIYVHCDSEDSSRVVGGGFKGAMKNPKVWKGAENDYVVFLSDMIDGDVDSSKKN